MANIINGHLKSPFQKFSVETVRGLLETDNKGIAKLCAQVSLMPKKDDLGRTYFTKDDLEILRRVKAMNKEVNEVKEAANNAGKAYATVPVKVSVPEAARKAVKKTKTLPGANVQTFDNTDVQNDYNASQNFVEEQPKYNIPVNFPVKKDSAAAIEKICSSLEEIQETLSDKISNIIEEKLEEKLDGIDEVVVELVRCKTENETLRYKMNELNKEVYNLKNELSRYKSIGMGFYIKKNGDSSLI